MKKASSREFGVLKVLGLCDLECGVVGDEPLAYCVDVNRDTCCQVGGGERGVKVEMVSPC